MASKVLDEQTWYSYFKENMQATPLIIWPDDLRTTFATIMGLIYGLADYVGKYGDIKNYGELVKHLEKLTKGRSLMAARSTVVARVLAIAAEAGVAYYAGAMIASATIASVRSYSGFANKKGTKSKYIDGGFYTKGTAREYRDQYINASTAGFTRNKTDLTVTEVMSFAIKNNIPTSVALQKVLHRYPELRKDHTVLTPSQKSQFDRIREKTKGQG